MRTTGWEVCGMPRAFPLAPVRTGTGQVLFWYEAAFNNIHVLPMSERDKATAYGTIQRNGDEEYLLLVHRCRLYGDWIDLPGPEDTYLRGEHYQRVREEIRRYYGETVLTEVENDWVREAA